MHPLPDAMSPLRGWRADPSISRGCAPG